MLRGPKLTSHKKSDLSAHQISHFRSPTPLFDDERSIKRLSSSSGFLALLASFTSSLSRSSVLFLMPTAFLGYALTAGTSSRARSGRTAALGVSSSSTLRTHSFSLTPTTWSTTGVGTAEAVSRAASRSMTSGIRGSTWPTQWCLCFNLTVFL